MPAAALLLSVLLAFPFGAAEATALSTVGGLSLEVSVEVLEPASAVLVRGVGPVDELPPVSLIDRGDGIWSGLVELPVVEDISIAFELIPVGGGASSVSELHRLSELGVDPAVFEAGRIPQPIIVATPDEGTGGWVWLLLGVTAGVLALVLVAWWARPGRRAGRDRNGTQDGDLADDADLQGEDGGDDETGGPDAGGPDAGG